MTRLTPLTYDAATPEQREVWDAILATRGDPASLIGPDQALMGPFNAMASAALIGGRTANLGQAIRFQSRVPDNLHEIAIITVGVHWRANFEWWAHARFAQNAGVDDAVIDAIGSGDTPHFTNPDEATVHAFAAQLVGTGRVDDATYEATRDTLGEDALVDLVATIGYYCMISLTLNAFSVPLPPGETPKWED